MVRWSGFAVLGIMVATTALRSQDAGSGGARTCDAIESAMRKLNKAEQFSWLELYATSNPHSEGSKSFWLPTQLIRRVYGNNITYMKHHGPVTSDREPIFANIEQRNIRLCVKFPPEFLDKEPVDIWTYYEEYDGRASFGAMWISQTTGLPLRTEREYEPTSLAVGSLRVEPIRYRRTLFKFGPLPRFDSPDYGSQVPFRTFPKP